ncbi:MAG TPA: carboxypeptidase regulatory-like domain-containing protein, partial [Lamprocystis sp. (in: g-proteobacteria)]|nr:carboxypeptidase regulatory-like domain-containing protein [Lamprocystis sp. (in: g-proteobacteria)]
MTDVAAGGGTAGALALTVNPTQSPSFQTRARVTGAVNAAAGPQLPPTPFAVIASLAPVNSAQGERVTVVLGGAAVGRWATHFAVGRTTADFGDGITVEQVQVSSPTAVAVTLQVAANAAPGVRQVRLTTGDEIAVAVLGFRVEPGVSSVSGVLRDTDTGAPIAGAVVGIEGSTLRAITAADGSFTLNGVPTGERTLLVNAPNHGLIRRPVSASPGAPVALDDLSATPTVPAADAAPSASVPSLLQRSLGDPTRPMSLDAARAIVRDALMLVGGTDIGILDADGNQQNPEVGGDIPFFSLNEYSVATIAERMLASERRTLGEVLYEHTLIWNWDGEAPRLLEWLSALQTLVDQAWANPGDRRYALLYLLFNPERGLLSSPPTIVADTPLNALQATLMELTLLRYGSRTVDPEALHDRIVVDYPELAAGAGQGTPTAQDKPPGLFARLLRTLVSPALAVDPLKAVAERAAYQIHVREKVSLAARVDANPEVAGLSYQWTLVATPPGGASAAFTRTNERIAYLQPTLSGEYRLRLAVSAPGHATAETEVTVTAGDACNDNFKVSIANADATWEELACVFAKAVPKGLTQGAVTGQFWGWLKGAAPISSYDAKLAAANNLKGFNVINGIGYPPGKITAMKALEVALPSMLKTAETQGKILQASKFSVKLLLSSTAGFIQGQAAQLSRDIMYAVLDATVLKLVDSVRPAPPTDVSAEPITSPGIKGGVAVLLTFDRSPSHDQYNDTAADQPAPQFFYYKIYRERSAGVLEQIFVGPQSRDGPLRGFPRDSDGKVMLTFVDAAPPVGQIAYYIKARRILGSKQVNIEEWNEAKFWTEQVMGVLSPPGLNQYSFAAAMTEKGVDLLKKMQLQDSDPSLPARLYVPRTLERLKLPVTLAATPVVGPYNGEVLMSVPEADTVFSFNGGSPQPLLNSGFAAPFMAGMAVDSLGNVYLNNAASEQRFGGRIFRWNPALERTLFGSVQYFSQLLMYAQPVAVRAMAAGWMNGGERIYIADNASDTLRELAILPDNRLPPNPGHYVSQPITSPGQVPIRADIAMAVNGSEGELLVADGDNLFRYRDGEDAVSDRLFADGTSPFTQIGGVDADANGNLYIGDSAAGELLAIP